MSGTGQFFDRSEFVSIINSYTKSSTGANRGSNNSAMNKLLQAIMGPSTTQTKQAQTTNNSAQIRAATKTAQVTEDLLELESKASVATKEYQKKSLELLTQLIKLVENGALSGRSLIGDLLGRRGIAGLGGAASSGSRLGGLARGAGRLALGGLGAGLAYESLSGGYLGKNKSTTSRVGGYLGAAAGGAATGASIGGPWGALIGGVLGLGTAAYSEYKPEINKLAKQSFMAATSMTKTALDFVQKMSWNDLKTFMSTGSSLLNDPISKITGMIGSLLKNLMDYIYSAIPSWQSIKDRLSGADSTNAGVLTGAFRQTMKAVGGIVGGKPGSYTSPVPTYKNIADLSNSEEGKPGSIGFDSRGGYSYGQHQIASNVGTLQKFLDNLKNVNPAAYKKLQDAGGIEAAKAGSARFIAAWKELDTKPDFLQAQNDFINQTHYQPAAQALASVGFDPSKHSQTLQGALYSTAVQHGPGSLKDNSGAVGIFQDALKNLPPNATDEQILAEVYRQRGIRNPGTAGRYAREYQKSLKMLQNERTDASTAASPSASATSQLPVAVTGDSIAFGLGQQKGVTDLGSHVGDHPDVILKRIQGLTADAVKGKSVVLSSGASNGYSAKDFNDIEQQIQALQKLSAAEIKLLGVGDRGDYQKNKVNDQLQALAKKYGVTFSPLDTNNLRPDRVHPQNYPDALKGITATPVTPSATATDKPFEQMSPQEKFTQGNQVIDQAVKDGHMTPEAATAAKQQLQDQLNSSGIPVPPVPTAPTPAPVPSVPSPTSENTASSANKLASIDPNGPIPAVSAAQATAATPTTAQPSFFNPGGPQQTTSQRAASDAEFDAKMRQDSHDNNSLTANALYAHQAVNPFDPNSSGYDPYTGKIVNANPTSPDSVTPANPVSPTDKNPPAQDDSSRSKTANPMTTASAASSSSIASVNDQGSSGKPPGMDDIPMYINDHGMIFVNGQTTV